MVSEISTYKQIIRYMDDFHRDLGRLIVLIERLMEEQGYFAFSSAGNRASWGLSSHYESPQRWRVPNLARLYAPDGEDAFDETLAFFIALESDTVFPFPALLCARITHQPFAERDAYYKVWNTDQLQSLAQESGQWQVLGQEDGWYVARPSGKYAVNELRGYFLNVFDLIDRQHVIDNVLLPLTSSDMTLDELLTISKYGFGGVEVSDK